MELDYVIYTENALVDNKPVFAVYGGLSTSPNLRDMNGKEVDSYVTMLDSLEVGKEAYKERRQIYEHLRINNHKGELLHSTDWLIVTEITESDILNLAKSVICDDDFEVDLFVNAELSNPVKKIIYQKISE